MKSLLTTLFVACSLVVASAQDADKVADLERRVRQLEEQVATLEQRLAETDNRAAASQQTPEAKKMQTVARQHMQEEQSSFSPEDIRKAEALYVAASKVMRERGNPSTLLDSVVSMYPQLNRAGCAQLYRAHQETGEEKVLFLKDCIARFSTCYYGDGTQVGPLAMFELAVYYQTAGDEQEARKLFRELRTKYPGAVDHDGALLADKIP